METTFVVGINLLVGVATTLSVQLVCKLPVL